MISFSVYYTLELVVSGLSVIPLISSTVLVMWEPPNVNIIHYYSINI